MTHRARVLIGFWILSAVVLPARAAGFPGMRFAQDSTNATTDQNESATQQPETAESRKFTKIADRYWSVLSKRPRRGAAFDQWYRHYLDAGRLHELKTRVAENAKSVPDDSGVQTLYGLVLQRSGDTKNALKQFKRAAQLDPKNYYPKYLAADLLNLTMRRVEAIEQFREVLKCDIPRIELSTIYKKLGRAQLRQQDSAAGVKTFNELAQRFPKDKRIITEVAQLLASEKQFAQAIARWQQARQLAKGEPFETMKADLAIADLLYQQGDATGALTRMNSALDNVRPDGWMAKDIRRRVERVFLEKNDTAGLLEWSRSRARERADDPHTLMFLAKTLSRFGKPDETISVYQNAIKQSPGNFDLRAQYIQELLKQNRQADAEAASRALVQEQPTNTDARTLCGDVILRPFADRFTFDDNYKSAQAAAVKVWSEIPNERPDDPTLAIRVANMCREAVGLQTATTNDSATAARRRNRYGGLPMVVAAENFYREAIRRQPENTEYNEFLGEFLVAAGRPDEASVVLQKIVPEDSTQSSEWHRLAGIMRRFRFLSQATAAAKKAVQFDEFSFSAQEQLADLFVEQQDYDNAVAALLKLEPLANTSQRKKTVLQKLTDTYFQSGQTATAARECRVRADDPDRSAAQRSRDLQLLSAIFERQGNLAPSAETLGEAVKHTPKDAELMEQYAQMLRRVQLIDRSIKAYKRVTELSPQSRVRTGLAIARMQYLRKERDEAKEIVRDLMVPPPTRSDYVQKLISLAGQLSLKPESIELLRHLLKLDPTDVPVRLQLADFLSRESEELLNLEAMEHYRRALHDSDNLDDKLSIVDRMAGVARSVKAIDSLLDELSRIPFETRERGLILAQVHLANNNRSGARIELRELLAKNPQDIVVLERLANLEAADKSYLTAAEYRQELASITGDPDILLQLAREYELGERTDKVADVAVQLLREHNDDTFAIKQITKQMQQGNFKAANRLLLATRRVASENVDLLYLSGVNHLVNSKWDEAFGDFQSVMELAPVSAASNGHPALASAASADPFLRAFTFSPSTPTQSRSLQTSTKAPLSRGFHNSSHAVFSVFNKIGLAQLAYLRLRRTAQVVQKFDGRSDVRLSANTATNQGALLDIPLKSSDMALDATVFMYQLNRFRAEQVLTNQSDDSGRIARLRILLSVVNDGMADLEELNEFARLYPLDPLPHLAMLRNRIPYQSSPEKQKRLLSQLRKARAWLEEQEPKTASLLTLNYVTNLARLDAQEEAAQLLAAAVPDISSSVEMQEFLGILPNFASADVRNLLLEKTAKWSQQQAMPASTIYMFLQIALADPHVREEWNRHKASILPLVSLAFERADATGLPRPGQRGVFSFSTGRPKSNYTVQRGLPVSNMNPTVMEAQLESTNSQLLAIIRDSRIKKTRSIELRQQLRPLLGTRVRLLQQGRMLMSLSGVNYEPFPAVSTLVPSSQFESLRSIAALFEVSSTNIDSLSNGTIPGQQQPDVVPTSLDPMLNDLLNEFASQSKPPAGQPIERRHDRNALAHAYLLWWFDRPDECIAALSSMAERQRQRGSRLETETRLALSKAQLCERNATGALAELNRIEESGLEFPAAYQFRHMVHAWLLEANLASPQILELELQSPFRPALNAWLSARATTAPGKNASFRSYRSSFGYSVSRYPLPGGPLQQVIEKMSAQQAARLADVAQEKMQSDVDRSADGPTAALAGCLALKAGRVDNAARAFQRWRRATPTIAQSRKIQLRDPVATQLVAHFAKREPKLASLALDLIAEIVVGSASEASAPNLKKQIDLAIRNESGELIPARCSEFSSHLIRHVRLIPFYFRTFPGESMLLCLPPQVIPTTIAELFGDPPAESKNTLLWREPLRSTMTFRRSLCLAVDSSVAFMTPEDAQQTRRILEALIFETDKNGGPNPYSWQRRKNKYMESGALVQQVVRLAERANELKELRERWAGLENASAPTMLLLRIEAADIAGDEKTAEELIRQFSSVTNPTGVKPWSDAIRARTNPDYFVAELVIGNGDQVWVEPGGRIYSLSRLPEHKFHISTIRMHGRGLNVLRANNKKLDGVSTDRDGPLKKILKQISLLKNLNSVSLNHLPITDEHIELISRCGSLKRLTLTATVITDKSADYLSRMQTLESLTLKETNLSASAVAKIRAALPNCRVSN